MGTLTSSLKRGLLPLIALLGALTALVIVLGNQKKEPIRPVLYPPASSPYEFSISAAGVIECSTLNIPIGVPFNEIIDSVYVIEGDIVKKGDLLFSLDTRALQAELAISEAQLQSAIVVFEDKKTQFSFYERLECKSAVSEQQIQSAYFAMQEAQEEVNKAKATVEKVKVNIERSTIYSPIDAFILQVNIRPGMVAAAVPLEVNQTNMILLGGIDPLYMRIDIDQDESWRYKKGACATAFVRGNSALCFPLEFVRIEPFIIPKSSFTGAATERVDTRVLQVLYRFDWKDLPIYPGQILDVFIEAEPRKGDGPLS